MAVHTPIEVGAKPVCSCHKCFACPWPGKHPRHHRHTLAHAANSATTDSTVIRSWWEEWPNANVGIAPGSRAGFIAFDVDPRHGGDETMADLDARLGRLPPTVEGQTGGGGRRLLYRQPEGETRGSLGPGVEVLRDGQQFVAPPSLHHSGRTYEWELSSSPDLVPIAALPDAWIQFLLVDSGGYRDGREDRDISDLGATSVVPIDPEDTAIPVIPVTQEDKTDPVPAVPAIPVVPVLPAIPVTPQTEWTVQRVLTLAEVRGRGDHDRCNMTLARGLKFNVGLGDVDAAKDVFDGWFEKSVPHFADKDIGSAWFKFARAFERAKIPLGARDLADVAFAGATSKAFPRCVERVRGDRARLLTAMCREMHLLAGGAFKLSSHQVARLFRIKPSQAWEHLHGLAASGILKCVDRGRPGQPGRGAAKWKYIGDDIYGSDLKGGPRP